MIVWITAAALELLILVRAFLGRTLTRFPIFYLYLCCVLAADVTRFVVYRSYASSYQNWYWTTEFISVILGYGVLMEIIEKGLRPFVGLRNICRITGWFVLAGVVIFAATQEILWRHLSYTLTSIEVERNLRVAELIILGFVLFMISRYDISITRNLKGIISGYGLFIAADVMMLALRSFAGRSFQGIASQIHSYSYLAALAIWVLTLWASAPEIVPKPSGVSDTEYESLVAMTRESIGDMRSHLERASRP
jgi:hypothetical protein